MVMLFWRCEMTGMLFWTCFLNIVVVLLTIRLVQVEKKVLAVVKSMKTTDDTISMLVDDRECL